MKDVALGIAVRLENDEIGESGNYLRERQARLVKVVSALLEFLSEERVVQWMKEENLGFRGHRPMDLVNSAYATQDLLQCIRDRRNRREAMRDARRRLRKLMQEPSVLERNARTLRERLQSRQRNPGPPPEFPHTSISKPKRRR